jgi:cytidylate kinase
MGIVVTIGGPHGTGKSTYARIIATEFGIRYVSAGQLFRDLAREKGIALQELGKREAEEPDIDHLIDQRSTEEAKKGNVVVEGQLAAWMAKDIAQVRIYLNAPDEVRFARIARRDHVDYETARRQTKHRERIQRDRYKRYYGIDIDDLSLYNLILDTGKRSVEEASAELVSRIHEMLRMRST